jgi:aconitate hydratase
MITVHNQGMCRQKGALVPAAKTEAGVQATMAYAILKAHNTSGSMERLSLRFDAMASHDITYVGIIQTARASGMKEFPLPQGRCRGRHRR